MIIYDNTGKIILDIPVDDDSYRFRAIMQAKKVELHYSLPGHVELPVGAYIEFQGERYTLWYPEHFQKHGTRNLEYKVTLGGNEEILKKYKYKLLSSKPYKLKFPLTANPRIFIQLLTDNLNLYDSGWKVGTVIEATEKLVSFNHENCWSVLGRLAQEFDTEFEIVGKTLHFGKVEKFKDNPLALSYGKGNGFVPGLGRSNQGDNLPVEILYVQGGDKNINYSTYGSQTLLLPKSEKLEYEGRIYKTDVDGMYICRDDKDLASFNEDSFDGANFYPGRVGTISKVDTEPGKDADGKEVVFYNFYDTSIPANLDFKEYLIAGQTMTVIFQSGRLTGREFDVRYIHEGRKFEIVSVMQDGMRMPDESYCPKAGDTYAVFNISLPAAYICDNATRTGASWDMFREAVRYLREHEEQQFTFSGELDGIWAKKNWLAIGRKVQPGGYVDFSDTQFQEEGILIRITGVTDQINNPHSPKLDLSNTPVSGFLSDAMGKLEGEEVKNEQKHKEALSLTMRRWWDMVETGNMLEKAIEGFSASINPITVSTMQVRVGSEQLQYRYVNNKTTPQEYIPNFVMDNTTKIFRAPTGIIQHMTLGIDSISVSHAVSEYSFWDIEPYVSPYLGDDKSAYYLYLKCGNGRSIGSYLLTRTAYPKIDPGDGFYYFLVGTLGTEFDGKRSFETVYGYTEILPGRMTIGLIKSYDGRTYFDLTKGEVGGKIVFKDGSSGYNNISDRPNLQPIYDGVNDALTDAENASNTANNAAGIANGKSTVYYSQPSSGMKVNDLWVDGTHIRRWNGSLWEYASTYDNTETRITGGLVTTGAVAVGPSGNPTGGIAGSGSVRIWSGGRAGANGEPPATPTFRVFDNGSVYGRNSIICEDSNGSPTCGFSSYGVDEGDPGSSSKLGSLRIWAGKSFDSKENAPFRVYMNGYTYASRLILGTSGNSYLYDSGLLLGNDGQIVLRSGNNAREVIARTTPDYYSSALSIKDTFDSGSMFDTPPTLDINIGQSKYANVPRVWLNCGHAAGWGSGFRIESRYLGDANVMERTCINVPSLSWKDHLTASRVVSSPEWKRVIWDAKSGFFAWE